MKTGIYQYEPLWNEWYIDELIGKGSYGEVYKIYKNADGKRIEAAAKYISIPRDNERKKYRHYNPKELTTLFEERAEKFSIEISSMLKLQDSLNVVRYEDHIKKAKENELGWDIIIRMELLTSLEDYLYDNNFSRQDVAKLGIDICSAIECCQQYEIIHRDIKIENIFIDDNGNYKLGDFGVSKIGSGTATGTVTGTEDYMAPEISQEHKYNKTVDIYALGIAMYQLLNNRRKPFIDADCVPGQDAETEAHLKRIKGEKMPSPKFADSELARIILKACAFNRAERYKTPKEMSDDLKMVFPTLSSDVILEAREKIEQYYKTGNTEFDEQVDNSIDKADSENKDETMTEVGTVSGTIADIPSGTNSGTVADISEGTKNGTIADIPGGTNGGTIADTSAGTKNGTIADMSGGTTGGTIADTSAGTKNGTIADTTEGTKNGTIADKLGDKNGTKAEDGKSIPDKAPNKSFKKFLFAGIGAAALIVIVALFALWPKEISLETLSGLPKETIQLTIGGNYQLSPEKVPNEAEGFITFSSEDETIATVNEFGTITPLKVGEVKIAVQCENITEYVIVNIVEQEIPVTDIIGVAKTAELTVGSSTTVMAKVQPENATNQQITFESTNPDVATVGPDGVITAVKAGQTTIKVTGGEVVKELVLTVNEKTVVQQSKPAAKPTQAPAKKTQQTTQQQKQPVQKTQPAQQQQKQPVQKTQPAPQPQPKPEPAPVAPQPEPAPVAPQPAPKSEPAPKQYEAGDLSAFQ